MPQTWPMTKRDTEKHNVTHRVMERYFLDLKLKSMCL